MTRGFTRPHISIVHRWRDRYADYARYLDHERYSVSYISTEVGVASIPDGAAAVTVVSRTDDLAEVREALYAQARDLGPPARVVALKEDDLLVAARLRDDWACPGPRYEEQLLFRDKYLTCRTAEAAGLAVPRYAPVSDAGDVRAFARAHGWPVVVKPRASSASEGVAVLRGPADAEDVAFGDGRRRMVQVFDGRQIYHVDGVYTRAGLGPWRASRYLNSCLGFRGGGALGSVEEDDPDALAAIGTFTERLLGALTSGPGGGAVVFHLEVFRSGAQCALLEIGARVGGAEIAFLWREVHGIDLMRAAFEIQLGRLPRVPRAGFGRVAGWLLVPAPRHRPCRITEATPMAGRERGPYAEVVPGVGDVIPAADSYYEHVGGRFRFQGATSRQVEAAILETAGAFRVRGEPVGTAGPVAGVAAEAGR